MTLLTGLADDPFFDEERMFLHAALADMYFARYMLRRLGAPERARFSQTGFAYGDPSAYGYSTNEVYEEQLCNILYTLFGRGFCGGLLSVPAFDTDDDTLEQIAALDGGPLKIEDHHYVYGGDYEEILVVEIRTYDTGAPGTQGDRPQTSARERLQMLLAALRAAGGEGLPPGLHRWREGSERSRQLREHLDYSEHVLLLSGCESYAPQELFHEGLFKRLIRAYHQRDPRKAPPENDPLPAAGRSTV